MSAAPPSTVPSGTLQKLKEVRRRLGAHNVVVAAAGVAFYGLLALVPTPIALVSIYGLLADPAQIQEQVADVAGSLDRETQAFLTNQLTAIVGDVEADGSTSPNTAGQWAGLIIGIGLALWSSSGAVQKLMGTVAVAYEAEEGRPGLKVRAMAYGFTAAALVGVSLMVFVIGIMPSLLGQVDLGGVAEAAIAIFQLPVLGLLFALALTVLYRHAPDRRTPTPWRNPGALVGTLLFVAFAIAFSVYSANVSAMPASYGLLGSIAALMIFLQLTTISVIVGAEFNSMVEQAGAPDAGLAGRSPDSGSVDDDGSSPDVGFVKALAGLAALFVLGRSGGND